VVQRAGTTIRFWPDTDVIDLSPPEGRRIKSLQSHPSNGICAPDHSGAVSAGLPPLPVDGDSVVEVDRVVSRARTIALSGRGLIAAEMLAGRQVGIRIQPTALMFFDLDARELLPVWPSRSLPTRSVARGARRREPAPRLDRSRYSAGLDLVFVAG
jgi:hypothetical protein